jgi:pyruvate/2-oxoglutarate dehydrogenase complex dihydrolipoamide dehydrogenase (E3) component
MLLVAVGRAPVVNGLDLDKAGITYSMKGIPVDRHLRTSVKHIYAIGDCVEGNFQFTHNAGWQGYVAARNALLPMNDKGFRQVMAWTTFTDPEVAHTGLTEAEARKQIGDEVRVMHWPLSMVDRAVAENDHEGFIKVIHQKNGKLLGATIVAERAGEMITEFTLALERGLKMMDIANTMHVYPTYSMGAMRLAAQSSTDQVMNSITGTVLKKLAGGQ